MRAARRPRDAGPSGPAPRQRPAGRARLGVTFTVLAVLSFSMLAAGPAYSGFTTITANSANTFGASATFPTYPAAVGVDSPWAYYRAEESPSAAATSTAADSSDNARPGTYHGATDGPTASWQLDEEAGSIAGDSSGAVNTGTLIDSPTWTTGRAGSAVSLNGTTQYVDGARAAVDTSASFSVSVWVYLTSKTDFHTAVSQDGTTMSGFYIQYRPAGVDKLAFGFRHSDSSTAGVDFASGPVGPSLNTWYHLVGVYDSVAEQMMFYINGTLQDTTAHTTANAWNATGRLAVGRAKYDGANADFWPGNIDAVRLYQRTLTADEITTLADGSPATAWDFTEGSGTTTTDLGANGNTGTLTNATWIAAGHDGNAASFNGLNSRVTSAAAVNTNTSYTVSAWVYLATKTGNVNRTAISQDGTGSSGFRLQYDDGADRWAFVVSDADWLGPTVKEARGSASPTTNTWYHLTGVHDSAANTIKLYVNGALEDTTAYNSAWNATGTFAVGRGDNWGWGNEWWSGRIDSVRAYQRALSDAEAAALYDGDIDLGIAMTAGISGALQGAQQGLQASTAVAFAGRSNASTDTSLNNPTEFTIECWFRSASPTGGVLMNFGSIRTGESTNRDRMIYLDSDGKVTFGVFPGAVHVTVRSTDTYNDGAWHHVAASLGGAGMKLYLDGALVASDPAVTTAQNIAVGYWRWGGDGNSDWPNAPSTSFITGTIDEVTVHTGQLSDERIARHYAANH